MRHFLDRTILFIIFCGLPFTPLAAVTHFNQTFLMPQRSLPSFKPFESDRGHENKKLYSNLKISGFYKDSTNTRALGNYFSLNDDTDNVIAIGDSSSASYDFYFTNLVHTPHDSDIPRLSGEIHLNPRRSMFGLTLDYVLATNINQCDLFFKIILPLENVTTDLQASVKNEISMVTLDGQKVGLLDYFKGNITQKGNSAGRDVDGTMILRYTGFPDRIQKPLTHAKFGGKRSIMGLASVDFVIGYDFVSREDYGFILKGHLSIPTGNIPTSEYVFEPIVGNGGHIEVGIGFDSLSNIYNHNDLHVNFFLSSLLVYGFTSKEVRTLGINGRRKSEQQPEWGHYKFFGKRGEVGVFPFANIGTLPVNVTPQCSFYGAAQCMLGRKNFDFSIEYKLYAKESEKVTALSFDSNQYAIASEGYDTGRKFMVDLPPIPPGGIQFLDNETDLYTIETLYPFAASTPAQVTHTLSASIKYNAIKRDNEKCLSIGVGGGYEMSNDNAALSQYDIHANLTGYF